MLTVHRAERTDVLADALAELLARPLADPFAREVVAVPARGIERWLTQRLSTTLGATRGDGIAANIDFPSPARLVDEALSAASGTTAEDDPWHSSRVLWTLLDVIDDCLGEPWCAVLSRHLGHGHDDHRAGRRYATAAHLAELMRSYGLQRPSMIADWAAGRDTDGTGVALDDHLLWQPELWRRLRERIGTDSPSQRLDVLCARLRSEPELVDLPERVSLFGPTRLNVVQGAVLSGLGAHRDVHLWIPHPSPAMWSSLSGTAPPPRRADDDSALAVRHPLLAALARDVREFQARLGALEPVEVVHAAPTPPATLLGRLQADIRADRVPAPGSASADGTVQVHACHGPTRQVEVLRESLLHLFRNDSTLEPRDVIVMCPDVETYAPLVQAAFGQDIVGHPGHRLRVRLADRALRQTNPVLSVIAELLGLADGRVTASEVLDLAGTPPVRRRFTLDDDDLERLQEWTAEAGARWGLGVSQRRAFGLADFRQNTFATALDRILLGVTADESENEWLDLALPLDDVDSNDIDLAGRFAEYIDRLTVALLGLRGPQSAAQWSAALARALDLLVDVSDSEAWQLAQAHREIAAAVEHSGAASLRLADVRAMLGTRLAGRPTRANFRTGELTVCTMVPMRSVPHRVVVLLGLDDDVFPRGAHIDGDDVLAQNPCLGERDPRSEDRQLLLDAIMSAGEKVLLFYTGADPVTGSPRPPAIPLSEVRDVVAVMVGADDPDADAIVRRHPLQPFDARNFLPEDPFSFDTTALAGAVAAQHPSPPHVVSRAALCETLEAPPAGDVDLAELVAFLVHPCQGFLRQRLGVRIPELDEAIADALDVDLDPLARWNLGDRMLEARLAGAPAAEFRAAEWRRGTLPPRALGERVLDEATDAVEALVAACSPVHAGESGTVDVVVDLGDGRRLTGTVGGVHGTVIARSTFSKLGPKHRLTAWVQLLAVAASGRPGRWQAVTTGRSRSRLPAWRSTLLAPEDALEQLIRLVDLRDRGLHATVPMTTGASAEYAERRYRGDSVEMALEAADRMFGGNFGDGRDRHVAYLYGGAATLESLTVAEPLPDERAWFEDPSRFGVLARRLWEPLLASEHQGRP
ncbi:exodeoxyribonuclease V subunit gamma [Rhodococcus chondri]|uniref:RecBCD enzyme subunit RecC n=1 Tax=Rhodococcus chondri TaxID=3065941 RepID=A0ABU7JTS1_9NOCA|nr:exodeoxyribonuclease V subunit gamma [Rhodococcus sp. CC-R104]MEE2033413.1 exodeoxyribonuclease V subunit gamma [Rhodococcus sp. CC-R104]